MSNYLDTDSRLELVEKANSDLQDKVDEIICSIIELEERVTPAVGAQRVRDILDGI